MTRKIFIALLAGLIFGFGLVVSEMVNPAKVIAFLDIFGDWDPSLVFVMGGAIAVTFVGYQLVWRLDRPILANQFQVPGNRKIDSRLALGAVMFGVGWGLVGLCPGPSIVALSLFRLEAVVFFVAMLAGMAAFEGLDRLGLLNFRSN